MSPRLPNYLKSYRKRAGLSQDEVAFLLGCTSGAKVSRYERMVRQPTLETALACESDERDSSWDSLILRSMGDYMDPVLI